MPNKPKELYPKKKIVRSVYRDFRYGAIPELVDIPSQKGELTPYKKGLINKQIKEIAEKSDCFKIGASGDISIRMDDPKYRSQYNKVSILYKCKKEERAMNYEVELITKFKKEYPQKCKNKKPIKASKLTTYDLHYKIYIVYFSSKINNSSLDSL